MYDHGDTSGYTSQSEADFTLMVMLAFWFAADPDRVGQAFGESALGQPEKWTRLDYRRSYNSEGTTEAQRKDVLPQRRTRHQKKY